MDSNCMMNFALHIDQEEMDRHLQTPPGQFVDLDMQCRQVFGAESYYCAVSIYYSLHSLIYYCGASVYYSLHAGLSVLL